jgi:hypothetical protein
MAIRGSVRTLGWQKNFIKQVTKKIGICLLYDLSRASRTKIVAVSPQILENCGCEDTRFTDEQIIAFLKQAEAGMSFKELCHSVGFSQPTFYNWRVKYTGM